MGRPGTLPKINTSGDHFKRKFHLPTINFQGGKYIYIYLFFFLPPKDAKMYDTTLSK